MSWKVKFFQTGRGDYPVEYFILSQNKQLKLKIIQTIELLKDYGPFLRSPNSKKIGNKLYELRVRGKDAVRILYTSYKGTYYLLHIFKKKSQKTPGRDMKIGIDRTKEII